jgi:hypothetical protein
MSTTISKIVSKVQNPHDWSVEAPDADLANSLRGKVGPGTRPREIKSLNSFLVGGLCNNLTFELVARGMSVNSHSITGCRHIRVSPVTFPQTRAVLHYEETRRFVDAIDASRRAAELSQSIRHAVQARGSGRRVLGARFKARQIRGRRHRCTSSDSSRIATEGKSKGERKGKGDQAGPGHTTPSACALA